MQNLHLIRTTRASGLLGGLCCSVSFCRSDHPGNVDLGFSPFLVFTAWAQHHSWRPACMCGLTVFHLPPEWHCLSCFPKHSLALWLLALHLGTFGSADDLTQGMQSGKMVGASLTHVESTEMTLTNWGYFINEVYEGDTVIPSPSLSWKPNTNDKDFTIQSTQHTTLCRTSHDFLWCSAPQ